MTAAPAWRLSARAVAAGVRAGTLDRAEAALAGFGEPATTWEQEVRSLAHGGRAEAAGAVRSAPIADGPLAGVAVVAKDNLCTTDFDTTCCSRILEGWRAPYDATAIARLRAAGAAIVGKGNMDEFAMGSSTEHSCYGPTRNPFDLARVAGGSSGGPAAAVACGIAPLALGSDTGGSVRQPAAFCGVYGLKPTYGRVSRYGLVAFGSSLDQVGVFARHAGDVAAAYGAIAGPDPFDATSIPTPPPDVSGWRDGVEGMTFGWPDALWAEGVEPELVGALEQAASWLEAAGARRVPVTLSRGEPWVAAYYLLATAEASSNLARFDGVRYGRRATAAADLDDLYVRSRSEGFGDEVQRRILLGTYALSAGYYDAYYARALRARDRVRREYAAAFARCDVVLLPPTPGLPFALGSRTGDPLAMYLSDLFTIGANLAGNPALTAPVGRTPTGLPLAVQLLGPHDGEPVLLRAARALEVRGDRARLADPHDEEFAWPSKR